jgi:hypothetical protein
MALLAFPSHFPWRFHSMFVEESTGPWSVFVFILHLFGSHCFSGSFLPIYGLLEERTCGNRVALISFIGNCFRIIKSRLGEHHFLLGHVLSSSINELRLINADSGRGKRRKFGAQAFSCTVVSPGSMHLLCPFQTLELFRTPIFFSPCISIDMGWGCTPISGSSAGPRL